MKIKLEKLALAVKDLFKIDIGGVSFDVNGNDEKQDIKKENPQIKDKHKKQLQ